MQKLVPKKVFLTKAHEVRLKVISEQTGLSLAELLRRILDGFFNQTWPSFTTLEK